MSPGRPTVHSLRSATILEYVILAVGIGIAVVCALLAFGEVAQSKMDDATQVLAGTEAGDEMDSAGEPAPDPRGAGGGSSEEARLGGGWTDERGELPASRSGGIVSGGGGGFRGVATSATISRRFRRGGGGGVSGSDAHGGFRRSGGRSVGASAAAEEPLDHEAPDPVQTKQQRWLFWLICAFLFFPLALLTIRLRMK